MRDCLPLVFIFTKLKTLADFKLLFLWQEDEQESYSILELYRTEYEDAQLENQAAQTQPQDQAAQTQPHDQGPHDQAPQDQDTEPQDEAAQDQNTEPQDHNQAEDDRDHNQNEQESQEEAQNEQKADNIKVRKWKRKKTEEVHTLFQFSILYF